MLVRVSAVTGILWGAVLAVGCGGTESAGSIPGGGGTTSTGSAGQTGSTGGANGSGTGGSVGGSTPMPGGNPTTLPCGSQSCSIPAQVCCIDQNGGSSTCVAGNSCGGAGTDDAGGQMMGMGADDAGEQGGPMGGDMTALKCSGAANCAAGTVCCINQDGASACAASCGRRDAQLCDPAAAVSGCGDAGACSSMNIGDWGLPSTFGTCGGVEM